MRPASRVAAILLTATAIAATGIAVLILAGADLQRALSLVAIRARDPVRPLVFGATASVALLIWQRRSRVWRLAAFCVLATIGVVSLLIVARGGPPAWAFGDGALIELYTRYAAGGSQLLGAYSQYGWHHPGPALFYLLVPFYAFGGQTIHALNAAALAINLVCLILSVWVIARRTDCSVPLAIALSMFLAHFVARIPSLLTSVWNPHIPVFPFLALLVVAAASIAGDFALLPWVTLLASFAAQAHVGLVPVTQGLLVVTFGAALALGLHEKRDLHPFRRWTTVSAFIFFAMWLLPIAEQIVETPGNMTRIARYFLNDTRPGQTAFDAWAALSETLALSFRLDFHVPRGWPFERAPSIWPLAAGTALLASLPVAMMRRRMEPARFERSLAWLSAAAAAIGFWSIMRIRELIADHAIFWLSTIGLICAALIAGQLIALGRWRLPTSLKTITAALVIAGAASFGVRQLVAGQSAIREENAAAVQVLSDDIIKTMRQAGIVRPRLQVGDRWDIAVGVVLQMIKEEMSFSVDPSEVAFYGRQLALGEADWLFTFAGPALHEKLVMRPDNLLVARYHSVFVDGIRVTPPAQP